MEGCRWMGHSSRKELSSLDADEGAGIPAVVAAEARLSERASEAERG